MKAKNFVPPGSSGSRLIGVGDAAIDAGSAWHRALARGSKKTAGVLPSSGGIPSASRNSGDVGESGDDLRNVVLSTFHSEWRTMNNRASNVVIQGFKPDKNVSDDDLVKDLISTHLSVYVDLTKTCRIGKPGGDGCQPLLVFLKNPADAAKLIDIARVLRSSSDPVIRSTVFINKHLTPAEAKSVYEARVLRRSK